MSTARRPSSEEIEHMCGQDFIYILIYKYTLVLYLFGICIDLVFVLYPSEVTVSRIDPLVVPEDRYHSTLELTTCLPCISTLSPLLSPTKSGYFRKCDFNKLNNMISQYNLDVESATELFYSVLNSFFCECVPLDRPPWFTNQLQRLRNIKTSFYICGGSY